MSRPIKFRAWFKEPKMMLSSDDIYIALALSGKIRKLNTEGSSPSLLAYGRDDIDDDFVLMQFTGLHDKNGKPIFEGDIIGSGTSYPLEVFWMGLAWGVRWNDNGTAEEEIICDDGGDMEMDEKQSKLKYMEVLGNIYENPEMVKA